VGIERSLERQRRERKDLGRVLEGTELQAEGGRGEHRARPPFEPEAFDEDASARPFDNRHPGPDDKGGVGPVTPVRPNVPGVLGRRGAGRDDGGRGDVQELHTDFDGVRVGVVDVQDVEALRTDAMPAPPAGPGDQPVAAQGNPEPLGMPVTVIEVAGDFLVEVVGESAKQLELVASADGTDGQVVKLHGRGTPGWGRPPVRGQTWSGSRMDTGAAMMRNMAPPSGAGRHGRCGWSLIIGRPGPTGKRICHGRRRGPA
jgi:hypothetical protein